MDEQNYNGGARGRVATEFVLVTEAFMAPHGGARALEGVSCANVLLMHAWCDNNTDPAGSVAFYERAQCAGSKALLLFGGDADASELRTAGPPTAHAELEALKDVDMCHLLTQEPVGPSDWPPQQLGGYASATRACDEVWRHHTQRLA